VPDTTTGVPSVAPELVAELKTLAQLATSLNEKSFLEPTQPSPAQIEIGLSTQRLIRPSKKPTRFKIIYVAVQGPMTLCL